MGQLLTHDRVVRADLARLPQHLDLLLQREPSTLAGQADGGRRERRVTSLGQGDGVGFGVVEQPLAIQRHAIGFA